MPPTSVLSDGTIRRLVGEGRVRIEPWDEGMVQPASVDLRLGSSFRVFHNHRLAAIDLADPPQNLTELVEVRASHLGMGLNAEVYHEIAHALARLHEPAPHVTDLASAA